MGFLGAESGSKAGGRADGVFSGAASAAGKGRPEKREGSATAGASTASGRNGGGGTAGKERGERSGGRRSRRAAPVADGVAHGGEAPTDGAVLVERRVLREKSSGAQKREGARGERGAGADIGGREERGRRPCRLRRDVLPHAGLRAPMTGSTTLEGLSSAFPHPVADSPLVEKAAGHEKRPGKRRAPASFIKEGPVRENPVKERRFYLEPPACSRPRFFSSTSRQASAAGVTPEMRPACPSVRGRMAESFSCISRESPEMPS